MKYSILSLPYASWVSWGLPVDARVVNRLGGADFTTLADALVAANANETIEIDAAGNPYPSEGSLFVNQNGVTIKSRNGTARWWARSLLIVGSNVTLDGIAMDGQAS